LLALIRAARELPRKQLPGLHLQLVENEH